MDGMHDTVWGTDKVQECEEDPFRPKTSLLAFGQHGEALPSSPPRGTNPESWGPLKKDIRLKPCERAGILQGDDVEDLSMVKLGEPETSERSSDIGETSLSAGQSGRWCGTTVGETTGTSICPQNGPRPSESRGTLRVNLPLPSSKMTVPAADRAKSMPEEDPERRPRMLDQVRIHPAELTYQLEESSEFNAHPQGDHRQEGSDSEDHKTPVVAVCPDFSRVPLTA
jgi:hypothetical protein